MKPLTKRSDDDIRICSCDHAQSRHVNRGMRSVGGNRQASHCTEQFCTCSQFRLYRHSGTYSGGEDNGS